MLKSMLYFRDHSLGVVHVVYIILDSLHMTLLPMNTLTIELFVVYSLSSSP